MQNSEVPKISAENLIPVNFFELNIVTSYFDVYSPSITVYENGDTPKIHLTAEEPPWDPLSIEYSEKETQILDHQGSSRSDPYPTTAARVPVFVSAVISCSLAYVMDSDNLATAIKSHVQISIVLIGMVKKLSVEPIVLAIGHYP